MKKVIATTLVTTTLLGTTMIGHCYDTKQKWYDDFMEAEYEKETMFHLISELNLKYDKNIFYLQPIEFEVSYYTDLDCENGFGPINCVGEPLIDGMVANNILELGTQIYFPELGLKTVSDRGSAKYFSKLDAVDVFVPRNKNESDADYYKRVNNLGRHTVTGYILMEDK